MISTIKFLLSWFFRLARRSGFHALFIDHASRVLFWRITPFLRNRLHVGHHSFIETKIVFEREEASVSIGDRTFIGKGIITASKDIKIGSDVMIAWGVVLSDHNSHSIAFSGRKSDVVNWLNGCKDWSNVVCAPIYISDKVWIGLNSIILKGVTIGEGAVIGAGSVVTKDVAPWTIVAGNPARVIREISENDR